MLNPQSIQPESTLAHPARSKPQRVYGQPRPDPAALPQQHPPSSSNRPLPSFLTLSTSPVVNASLVNHVDSTCLPQRKTIQEQLAEIDAMPDADLARLVPPPSAQQPAPEPGPSSQPFAALPTSLAHSVASSRLHDSPPSSMPRTPLDLSPFAARRPKRLRVSDSDSEAEAEADLDGARGLPKHAQKFAPDDDSLPTLEEALAGEQALALAEARSALALEPATRSPKQPPPVIHSDISGAESEPTPKPKSKKLKGLSKKDKEETQRTIALCERQRPAKLIGSCRAPNSRLDDIIMKATAATSVQNSSAASRAVLVPSLATGKKTSNLTALTLEAHQSARSASDSLTSPIDEFPAVGEALPDDDDDDELLPDLDEVFSAPPPRIDAEATKKQAWLAQLRQTRVQEPSHSRLVESDSDDAELDIVGQPKPTRLVHPSPKDVLAARSMARRTTKRPSLPFKALLGSVDDRVKLEGQHLKHDVMKGLLQRSAVEGALLREQKRAEFVERGGKLARETASRAALDSVDLKAILKKNEEEEGVDPEDAVDCDWEEEIELSGNEDDDVEEEGEEGSSSMDEDEPAGEEASSVTEEGEPGAQEALQTAEDEVDLACKRATSSTKSSTSSVLTDMPYPGQPVRKCLAPATVSSPNTPLTDSPRPDGALASPTAPSSPIDLPGFNLKVERPRAKSFTATVEDLDEDLPGFGPASNSAGFSGSLGGLSQSEELGCLDKQADQAGFSQLFGDDDQLGFTHPPPALKQAESVKDGEDGAEELGGTCVLPAVHVLPEERDRDMVMMMLGAQQRSMEEEEHEPTQYVNHRGLLTQHKPSLDASKLPESPLMSQDLMARTPFALRKDRLPDDPCEDEQADGEAQSPCGGRDFDVAGSPSARDRIKGPKPLKDAFAAVMEGRLKETRERGAGRLFLADQADESDDEFGGGLGGRPEEEDESDSEAGQAELAGLVDDGADERDEATRLAGDEAMEALALQHQQEAEARQADHVARLVAGKVRLKQARRGRGDGGISESDSEDDEEEEWVKANKRAQEFAAKKKKMAIHRLAEKHAPFFKSYEEGTSQWVDEDDLACLQPEEPKASGGESEDEEDDEYEEVMFERTSRHRSSYSRARPRQEAAGEESEGSEEGEGEGGRVARVNVLSSSPVKLPPLKISDPTLKRAGGMGGPSKSAHADLDSMYNWKQAAELTERQKQGVAELVGEERAGERRGAGKSSSITYQHLEQQRAQKKAKEMDLREGGMGDGEGSRGKGSKGKGGGGNGRLARLKGSNK